MIVRSTLGVHGESTAYSLLKMVDVENRSDTDLLGSEYISHSLNQGKKMSGRSLARSVSVLALLMILGSLAYSARNARKGVVHTFSLLTSTENEGRKVEKEIMLFGDSLIGVPTHEYQMGEKLESDLESANPDYDTVISVSFGNGNTAFELYDRVDEDVLSRDDFDAPPKAVVILFDTDAADEPDGGKDEYKENYKEKLSALLQKLKAKIDYVALAGPILKGEYKENDIDPKLDEYEEMNKEIAKSHNVDYIPLRDMFQDAENGYDKKSGHLTQDGQHPTEKGAEIIEKAFKKQILSWNGLYSGPSRTNEPSKFELSQSMEKLVSSLKASASYSTCVESIGKTECSDLAVAMEAAEQEYANFMGSNLPDIDQKLNIIINNI